MTLDDVLSALRNADAAGDTEAARQLANIAQRMQAQSPQRIREESYAEEDRIRAERRAARQQTPEEETTFGGQLAELGKGVIPGAVGLLETAGTGIASMFDEDTEKAAREAIKDIAGVIKKPFEAAPVTKILLGATLVRV